MSERIQLERRRTGWDIVFGILAVIAGVIVLTHVAVASVVSVLFIGWLLLIAGIVLVVSGIAGWRETVRHWDVAAGALFVILGLGFVRFPEQSLAVLTLLAGSLLVVGGIVRLVVAFEPGAPRGVLVVNGVLTLLLGLLVLFQWPVSALWFLGVILGVQLLLDGVTTAMVGRVRIVGERGHVPAA